MRLPCKGWLLLTWLPLVSLGQATEDPFLEKLLAPEDAGGSSFEDLLESALIGAPEPTPSHASEDLHDPFVDALFEELEQPSWQGHAELSLGVGRTDNILRAESAEHPDDYGYFKNLLTITRYAPGAVDPNFVGIALLEGKQYNQAQFVDNDVFALLQGEWAGVLDSGVNYALPFTYVFIDQVYDRTLRDLEPVAGRIRMNLLQLRPEVGLPLSKGWSAGIAGRYARALYAAAEEDYYEQGLDVELSGPVRDLTTLGVRFSQRQRIFFHRVARDAWGRPLREELGLELRYWDAEIFLKQYWTKDRAIYSDIYLLGRIRRDNGDGFYDYYRLGARALAGFTTGRLDFSLSAAVYHEQYTVQETRVGGPLLSRQDFEIDAELRWKITQWLSLFLAGQLLYSKSDDVASYNGRIVDETVLLRARDAQIGVMIQF